MCQGAADGRVKARGVELLADYRFRDAIHQVVFDALGKLSTDAPATIRALLPERLTRQGFPEVDLDAYFQPHGLIVAAAVSLMRELLAEAKRGQR